MLELKLDSLCKHICAYDKCSRASTALLGKEMVCCQGLCSLVHFYIAIDFGPLWVWTTPPALCHFWAPKAASSQIGHLIYVWTTCACAFFSHLLMLLLMSVLLPCGRCLPHPSMHAHKKSECMAMCRDAQPSSKMHLIFNRCAWWHFTIVMVIRVSGRLPSCPLRKVCTDESMLDWLCAWSMAPMGSIFLHAVSSFYFLLCLHISLSLYLCMFYIHWLLKAHTQAGVLVLLSLHVATSRRGHLKKQIPSARLQTAQD